MSAVPLLATEQRIFKTDLSANSGLNHRSFVNAGEQPIQTSRPSTFAIPLLVTNAKLVGCITIIIRWRFCLHRRRVSRETRAICREEDNSFGDLVGCGWTPRWCLSGKFVKTFAQSSLCLGPGLTALMRTPLRPYSTAHVFVSKLIAALLDP
jgi:hypothetical protein